MPTVLIRALRAATHILPQRLRAPSCHTVQEERGYRPGPVQSGQFTPRAKMAAFDSDAYAWLTCMAADMQECHGPSWPLFATHVDSTASVSRCVHLLLYCTPLTLSLCVCRTGAGSARTADSTSSSRRLAWRACSNKAPFQQHFPSSILHRQTSLAHTRSSSTRLLLAFFWRPRQVSSSSLDSS